jgi:hypothetical protein
MTVYVDDANIPATVANGRARHTSRWCHLFSDTSDAELHEFAARIGLKRAWFQKPDSPLQTHRHYDLTAGKRRQAVAAGAVEDHLVGGWPDDGGRSRPAQRRGTGRLTVRGWCRRRRTPGCAPPP